MNVSWLSHEMIFISYSYVPSIKLTSMPKILIRRWQKVLLPYKLIQLFPITMTPSIGGNTSNDHQVDSRSLVPPRTAPTRVNASDLRSDECRGAYLYVLHIHKNPIKTTIQSYIYRTVGFTVCRRHPLGTANPNGLPFSARGGSGNPIHSLWVGKSVMSVKALSLSDRAC